MCTHAWVSTSILLAKELFTHIMLRVSSHLVPFCPPATTLIPMPYAAQKKQRSAATDQTPYPLLLRGSSSCRSLLYPFFPPSLPCSLSSLLGHLTTIQGPFQKAFKKIKFSSQQGSNYSATHNILRTWSAKKALANSVTPIFLASAAALESQREILSAQAINST